MTILEEKTDEKIVGYQVLLVRGKEEEIVAYAALQGLIIDRTMLYDFLDGTMIVHLRKPRGGLINRNLSTKHTI